MVLTSDKWKEPIEFTKFVVIGKLFRSKKKFRTQHDGSLAGYYTVININLFDGRVWGVTEEGKRKLIKRIRN